MYVVNIKTIQSTRLTDNKGIDTGARLSPDGSMIVYSSFTGTDHDLFIMDSDGTNKKKLTNDDKLFNSTPRWSPDGTKIIFQASDEIGNDVHQLFLINVDGTGLVQLTDGTDNREPDWRRN